MHDERTEIVFSHENFGTWTVRSSAVPRVGDPVWFRIRESPEYVVKYVGYELSQLHNMMIVHVELGLEAGK